MKTTKIVDEKLLIEDPHFPAIRPVIAEKNKSFFGKVKSFFTFRRKFKLQEDFCVWSNVLNRFIFMPKGFIMDGASVPKILNSMYSSTGVLFLGAFPHDAGYRYQKLLVVGEDNLIEEMEVDRKTTDNIFLDVCSQENDMPYISSVAKNTLTISGWKA